MTEVKREVWITESEVSGLPEVVSWRGAPKGKPLKGWRYVKYVPEPAWIPVTELPAPWSVVLVLGETEGTQWQEVCRYDPSYTTPIWLGIPSGSASDEVTHWMPLPALPSPPEPKP